MSKEEFEIDTAKKKFREFLESLKELKEKSIGKSYKRDLNWSLQQCYEKEYQDLISDVETIAETNLNSEQRKSKTIPGAISRLKDEELKKLNSIIRIGAKNINKTPYAGESTQWERETADALDISAAFMEELSSRL